MSALDLVMPTLMLMRHGKSSWDLPYQKDHERPLAPRGEKAAAKIGRFLSAAGRRPDLVLTSTAVRARTTATLAAEAGGWRCHIVRAPELYSAGPEGVMDVVRDIETTVKQVLIVGHNPTWADLVSRLIGGGDFRFPTAAVACVQLPESSWSAVGSSCGELLWFVIPRLL
jgi:phosphohistidine phosphatase